MTVIIGQSDQKRQMLITLILNSASTLAKLDNATTSQVLRSVAHTLEKEVLKETGLCTHGCVVTQECQFRIGRLCKQKTIRCEAPLGQKRTN